MAGKVGSNMAAEIGGMRQKEHIDAMEVMGVNTASLPYHAENNRCFGDDTFIGCNGSVSSAF